MNEFYIEQTGLADAHIACAAPLEGRVLGGTLIASTPKYEYDFLQTCCADTVDLEYDMNWNLVPDHSQQY